MNRFVYGLAVAALVLVGCHTITEELPTQPTDTTPKAPASGVLKVTIPVLPARLRHPAPSRTRRRRPARPDAAPGADRPAASGGHGRLRQAAAPAHLQHGRQDPHPRPEPWTLDVTPQVHDLEYCTKIGFVNGRIDCPVRTEGAPDRLGVRDLRDRLRRRHQAAGADLEAQRTLLHRQSGRLREPRGEPVPALRHGQRLLRGVHGRRRLRRRPGGPLSDRDLLTAPRPRVTVSRVSGASTARAARRVARGRGPHGLGLRLARLDVAARPGAGPHHCGSHTEPQRPDAGARGARAEADPDARPGRHARPVGQPLASDRRNGGRAAPRFRRSCRGST